MVVCAVLARSRCVAALPPQIRQAAVEALALLQNVTTEDVDVIELLEHHHVQHEHIGAVLGRLHNTGTPLPRINTMGILELSYESGSASVGGTYDESAPPSQQLPLPSPPLHEYAASKDTDQPGFSSFWSEDSTEVSISGSARNRAMSASKDPRHRIPFEIPRASRPRSQLKQAEDTPTMSEAGSFSFSPREEPVADPPSSRKFSSVSDLGALPPSSTTASSGIRATLPVRCARVAVRVGLCGASCVLHG